MDRYECTLAPDDLLPGCDPRIATIHGYWRSIRPQGAAMPGRRHFDPAAVPRLLPSIRLYDVFRDPWRFRYRLFGTELVRHFGRDRTGEWFGQGMSPALTSHNFTSLIAVAEGQVAYHRGFPVFSVIARDHLTSERIMLPFARDGRSVDVILGFSVHHPVGPGVRSEALLHDNA